jgi:hypothetical protein
MNPNAPLSIFFKGGSKIGKTFTVMVIIQGLLQFYLNQNKDLDPSKQVVFKNSCIGKVAYNISGSTIHSGLAIPLNKSVNFKPLSDERRDDLIK